MHALFISCLGLYLNFSVTLCFFLLSCLTTFIFTLRSVACFATRWTIELLLSLCLLTTRMLIVVVCVLFLSRYIAVARFNLVYPLKIERGHVKLKESKYRSNILEWFICEERQATSRWKHKLICLNSCCCVYVFGDFLFHHSLSSFRVGTMSMMRESSGWR